MSDACVLFDTDTELGILKTLFEEKFKDFNDLVGDDCSILGSVSQLMKDSINVARDWEKKAKEVIAGAIKIGSEIWKSMLALGSMITEAGLAFIKEALNLALGIFEGVTDAVNELVNMVKESMNGVKIIACDLISDAVRGIPPELVVAGTAVAAIQKIDLAKKLNGSFLVGAKDINNLTKTIMEDAGAVTHIDSMLSFKDPVDSILNNRMFKDFKEMACVI